MIRWSAKLAALLLLAFARPVLAQDLASFEKNVTVKILPNGLTVVLYRRPEAPVFSFFTLVDAGSAGPTAPDRSGSHDGTHGLQGHA